MARAPELSCPRCGYDVSGVVPTWKESCPLDGTCSECGLRFAWVDIYRPERLYPKWSFEHARRAWIRSWVRTVGKTMRPARLWSQMPLAAPIRRLRLAVFVVLMLLLTHGAAAAIAVRVSRTGLWATAWWAGKPTPKFMWDRLWALLGWPYKGEWFELVGPLGLLLLVWGVLVPLPFLVLVDTMAKAKCRPAHLVRGWVYFLPTLAVVTIGDGVVLTLPWLLPWSGWGVISTPVWTALMCLFAVLIGLWYVRWWWLFTSHYLQLERARLVLMLMLVISFLAALLICLLGTQSMPDMIGRVIWHVQDWIAGK